MDIQVSSLKKEKKHHAFYFFSIFPLLIFIFYIKLKNMFIILGTKMVFFFYKKGKD